MAFKTDMGKAKKKAAAEAAKAASRGNPSRRYWSPEQGKNRIRIMPPWTDKGPNSYQFWRELYVHWNVGPDEENTVHLPCPKLSQDGPKGPCPVCEEAEQHKKSSDPADVELAKQMRAKQRAYSNIIDLDDPIWKKEDIEELVAGGADKDSLPKVGAPKVQVFSYGPKIMKQLLDFYTEEIDFTDLESGYDVIITREGTGLQTDYRVILNPKQSKAPVKTEPTLFDLDQLMAFKEPSEMRALMEGVDPEEAKQLEAGTEEAEQQAEESQEGGEEQAAEEPQEAAGEGQEEGQQEDEQQLEAELEGAEQLEYPPCYGKECDPKDSVCNADCQLFAECKKACGIEDEPPKPKRQAAAAKPAAKPAAKASPATGKAVGGAEDLVAQMRAAVGQK